MFFSGAQSQGQIPCLFSGIICGVTTISLTTLVTLFATSTLNEAPIRSEALAAVILDVLSLAALLFFTIVHFRKPHRTRPQRWGIALPVVTLSTIASILSIYVLAWMCNQSHQLEQARDPWNTLQLLNAALAMWVLSVIAQSAFFGLCLRHTSSSTDRVMTPRDDGVSSVEFGFKSGHDTIDMASFSPSSNPRSIRKGYYTHSPYMASPMASARNSLTSFLRPVTSKTRLVALRKDSFSRDGASITSEYPSEPVRREDGFETWEVKDPIESVSPKQCPKSDPLATIPGSRPASPAHPLDGPFPSDPVQPEETPLPESPPRALLDVTSRARLDSLSPLVLPKLQIPRMPSSVTLNGSPVERTCTPPIISGYRSRRPSGANDQSHIHPLFRTDSPAPPPVASPGTILTASIWGGLMVPADIEPPLPRSRKNSAFSRNGEMSRSASPASLRVANTITRGSKGAQPRPLVSRSYSHGDLRQAQSSMSGQEPEVPALPVLDAPFFQKRPNFH